MENRNKTLAVILWLIVVAALSGCGGSSPTQSIAPTLVSIAVGPPDASLAKGSSTQFVATGIYNDGSKKALDGVTWSSTNPGIVSFGSAAAASGRATAVTMGVTTITAASAGLSGSAAVTVTPATLVSIAVTPTNLSIAAGLVHQFVATGTYSDNSIQNVTGMVVWSSSSPSVATVSNDGTSQGVVTTVIPGTTSIGATLGGVSGTATLTVTPAVLASIGVTPVNPSVPVGLAQQFEATGVYTDGSQHDLTAMVTWSSAASASASVSNAAGSNGLATTVTPGTTTVSAALGNLSGNSALTVTAAALVSIGVTPANASAAAGLKRQFTAMGVYTDDSTHDLTAQAVWSSSVSATASVGNAAGFSGLASLLQPGTTTVSAAVGAVSGATTLTVTAAALVSIAVTPAVSSLVSGTSQQFIAVGTYTDYSTQVLTGVVTWASSTTSVATISNAAGSSGLATSSSYGTVAVTASLGPISGSASITVTRGALLSIAVTPTASRLAAGTSEQLAAVGTYTDHSTQVLTSAATWTSSAMSVAAVSNAVGSSGLLKSLAEGSTDVSATVGGVSGSTGVTVTAATLVSIGVTPPNTTLAEGLQQQFTATGVYTDNSKQDLTTDVAWSSSVTSVATISNARDSNGLTQASTSGSTVITAALGGISASTGMTVSSITLVSVSVSPVNAQLVDGNSQQFTATGIFSDNSRQNLTTAVTWSASDPTVVSLSNAPGFSGVAVALAPGTATIAASLGSVSGTTGVTVVGASLVSISVTPAGSSVPNGSSRQFVATGTYSNGSTMDLTNSVTWSSSDTAVAAISNASGSKGLGQAIATGLTTVKATSGAVTGSTKLTVTSAKLVSLAITPLTASLATGNSRQFTATGTYTDHSTLNLTASVSWTSADSSIASISNAAGSAGLATAARTGATHMTAAIAGVISPAATLTVNSALEYVYVANSGDNTVSQYTIGTDGSLTPMNAGAVPTGAGPLAIAVDPAGRYAYVANGYDNDISQFTIGADGALTAMSNPTAPAGSYPQSVAVDPTGRYVYAANNGDQSVSQFAIGANGALTPIGSGSVAAGDMPASVAVDPTGRYVYVANSDGTVSQFSIGMGGALIALSPASVSAGNLPQSVAVDPTGRYAYVANGADNTVSQFTIGAGGELVPLEPTTVSIDATPESVTVDPTAHYVYVANQDGTVSQFAMGANGALSPLSPASVQAGISAQSVAVDLAGRYVYVANESDDSVSDFTIGAAGVLPGAPTSSVAAGSGPYFIATSY